MFRRPITMNSVSDEPDSLFNLAMAVLVSDTEAVIEGERARGAVRPRSDPNLPVEVLERFLAAYQRRYRVDDNMARLLCESRARLRSIKLQKASITDQGLGLLLGLKPRELELIECKSLTPDSLYHIQNNCENLVSIKIVNSKVVGPQSPFTLDAPGLRNLTVRLLLFDAIEPLSALTALVHLDLSGCKLVHGLPKSGLDRLETLILHCVPELHKFVGWIASLSRLRVLDISQLNVEFPEPNEMLDEIVRGLPRLTHLDISGTNLAGTGGTRPAQEEGVEAVPCDVPGLASRVDRPLQFLGLFDTHHSACKRHDIPALTIAGDADEKQVLTAGTVYMERPAVLTGVLNDLYYLYRYEEAQEVGRALDTVLQAMDRHLREKAVQISGSALMFYIIKNKHMQQMSAPVKRRIISAILLAMETHMGDEAVMRNGCLGLTRFTIPFDVVFQYKKMAHIVLTGLLNKRVDEYVRRMGIYLLNSLACQVDPAHKQFLGKAGAIQKMSEIIVERIEANTCDTMLEMAWSTLWNMTDEMQDNCERFLRCNGLNLFLACLKSFPNKDAQLRNMMGLLGNVAENPPLRNYLMSSQLLTAFYELLDSPLDGIEVSYNAGGVLAHIGSDGPSVWTTSDPPRAAVMERLAAVIDSWDITTERNINYRSFRPILSLLYAHHTPQCQHWAAWALANLTTVYPDMYCKLIVAEDGVDLLELVLSHHTTSQRVRDLCAIVLDNVRRHPGPPLQ